MKLVTNKKMNLAGTLRTMEQGDILEVSSAGYAEAYVRSVASAVGREKDGRYVVNAIYDENNILCSFDSAMVVEGYIVDVVELYDNDAASEGNQMSLEFSFLLTSITYIGEDERHLRLDFVN